MRAKTLTITDSVAEEWYIGNSKPEVLCTSTGKAGSKSPRMPKYVRSAMRGNKTRGIRMNQNKIRSSRQTKTAQAGDTDQCRTTCCRTTSHRFELALNNAATSKMRNNEPVSGTFLQSLLY